MREASTTLVQQLVIKYGLDEMFKEPRIDLGGCESSQQFRHLFDYKVWDARQKPDVDRVVDARTMAIGWPLNSVGTLLSFDTFEHIFEMWLVPEQIGRLVFPSGHVVIGVPWSYSFHDASGDYWRFSPQALEKLFFKDFETVLCGFYDDMGASFYVGRRRDAGREPKLYKL